MSDEKKYYCFCGSNCKYETMTKEQILAAIAQAVEGGAVVNPNAGFITKVKETNGGGYVTFWVGRQSQYNAIEKKDPSCLYIITDDTSAEDLDRTITELNKKLDTATKTAETTRVLLQQALPVLIADKLSFQAKYNSSLLTEVTKVEATAGTTIYYPSMKLVFFKLHIDVEGRIEAGVPTTIECTFAGKYLPMAGYPFIATGEDRDESVTLLGTGDNLYIQFRAMKEYAYTNPRFDISGWYFCDGE